MTFQAMLARPWHHIGRNVYVYGADGAPVLVAVVDETENSGPSTVNAIASYVVDLHNATLTKRTINASGAALEAARR